MRLLLFGVTIHACRNMRLAMMPVNAGISDEIIDQFSTIGRAARAKGREGAIERKCPLFKINGWFVPNLPS